MDNTIENKKPDDSSSDDFEINDKVVKKMSELISLKESLVQLDCFLVCVLSQTIEDLGLRKNFFQMA